MLKLALIALISGCSSVRPYVSEFGELGRGQGVEKNRSCEQPEDRGAKQRDPRTGAS